MTMTLKNRSLPCSALCVAAVISLLSFASRPSVAADGQTPSEKEAKLLAVLKSDAPPGEKAVTCKYLAIYGSKESVPALAALLPDRELNSWARIALEAIPGPEADAALREAIGTVKGRLLIGVVNSIGVRRDAKAIAGLSQLLKDPAADVASAAAEALGHIGGGVATKALELSLADERVLVRSTAAYGCSLCAEQFLARGETAEAIRIYDIIRHANVPKQRVLEGIRGAILARRNEGIPLLLEQLRSADKAFLNVGLSTARELPGSAVTDALVAELDKANAERQVLLLRAVADRTDATVQPKVLQMAESGSPQLRLAALGLLDRFSGLAPVPVLLKAAVESDSELATTAKATLARLQDKQVDADLLARLAQATGSTRQVLIEIVGKRRIDGALPVIMRSAQDPDAAVRHAAVQTIGVMGEPAQTADLVSLLQKTEAVQEREDIEKALVAVCGRGGSKCLASVLPLAKETDSGLRRTGLHALSSIGGAEALGAVKLAIDDRDETVQDEAVRTLSNWPNNWPDDAGVAEPLLALVKSAKKTSYQVQGVRGYLQYVEEEKKLKPGEKVAAINNLLPWVKRTEEKRLVISSLSGLPTAAVLEPLISLADDSAVAEEACLAIVRVATAKEQKSASKELRQKALQTAIEKAKNDATRKKAEDGLKQIN